MNFSHTGVVVFATIVIAACTTSEDKPVSTISLQGGEWVVEDIDARGVIDYARTTMLFGQDGRISGNTACNSYFATYVADESSLQVDNAGSTRRACPPAVMDQESRFLNIINAVNRYHFDATGALVLSTPAKATITARRTAAAMTKITYRCADNSLIEVEYPTTDTARVVYQGQSIEMNAVVSASGARYVGGGWQWWSKGLTGGLLSPLAVGEDIASASGMRCTVP